MFDRLKHTDLGRIDYLAAAMGYLPPVQTTGKWLVLSVLVGIVAGLGATAFDRLEQLVSHVALEQFAGFVPLAPAGEHRADAAPDQPLYPWRIVVALAAGGLLCGALIYTFAPEAEGHGTDAAIKAFHHQRGYIRPIVPVVKLLASALTIGTGGSGGREGPIAQIGAGFGSLLATMLKLSVRDRRILLAVGIGAGIGAIFRAPMAGAIFAAEVLYRTADLEADVIVPAAVASIVGFSVFSFSLPPDLQFMPLFGDQLPFRWTSVAELLPLTVLAIVLAAVAIVYIRCFYGAYGLFKKTRLPNWLRPVVGAVIAGLIALGLYWFTNRDARALAVLGTGYGGLQIALTEPASMGATLLLALAAAKILATSATIGSGGSAGVFGPSMVIGGSTGAAVGLTLEQLVPQFVSQPGSYTVLGMAGFFAAAGRTPISTIIMVTELTGDFGLLVPAMWVSMLSFALCPRWTIYHEQVPSRLDSPAHRGEFLVDVLEGIKVADVPWVQRQTVIEGTPLGEIVELFAASTQHYFPVVDSGGRLIGVFSSDDVRGYVYATDVWQLANARDVMTQRIVSLTPADDLNTALRRFTDRDLDELPVVSAENSSHLLGMLCRSDVIACYNRTLQARKTDE